MKKLTLQNGLYLIGFIVLLYLLIAIPKSCPSQKPSLAENPKIIQKDKEIDSLKNELSKSDKSKDSIRMVADLRLHNLNQMKLKNESIKKEVAFNKKAFKELINQNKGKIAIFYGLRYNLPSDARTTKLGTEISDSLAYLNISELYDLDGAKKEISNLNLMLAEKDSLVLNFSDLWQLTEKQKNDVFKMYKAESEKFKIASDELDKEKEANSKEPIFTLFVGGGLGTDFTFYQFPYKANLGFQTRNRKTYIASWQKIGKADYVLGEVNIPLFTIKGKKK